MDEKAELMKLKKEYSDSFKGIIDISKMKKNGEALDLFDNIVKKMPAGQTLGNRVEELRGKSSDIIRELKRVRIDSFQRGITKFVNDSQDAGSFVRQTSDGWRIDQFEYALKNELAKVCLLYNREIIIPWTSVGSSEDLEKLKNKAIGMLKIFEIDFDDMLTALVDGFKEAERRRKQTNLFTDSPIDIHDFIREFRIALLRNQLTGKLGKKLKYADLPEWALLYNLDRYRMNMGKIPENERYSLTVPSQKAQSEGKSVLLGGLDYKRDYEYFSGIKAP